MTSNNCGNYYILCFHHGYTISDAIDVIVIYPLYFKLHVRWLRSVTRITYLSKLIEIPSLAAFLKFELFRG
ncbi:hypothetical protein D5071_11755 [Pectobacterium carotovorum]|uniref:Uncharacterized protein n=1 Tax=Pectobacterium carotovorum TaxID=554 RepID=A0A419AVN1_PECCA|nr:hypothetical protein D5071_11755 [Pectobacterium carotovorum]